MSTTEAQEAAASERIIKHMNADHSDSIRRYLEAFRQKSFYQVRDARMTNISVTDMMFSCGGQQVTIPFDPPMESLREARERVVQLDKDALQILGRSDITVTRYVPPYTQILHLYNFTQCLLAFAAFCRAANFRAGSPLFDNLLSRFPKFAGFCLAVQPYVFGLMLIIHTTEMVFMAKKMMRHGLTPFDALFWAWAGSCFIEGKTAFIRVDALIEEKRKVKEAKKH